MNDDRGEYIRRLRKQRGFSQDQLAEQVGVSQATISEWERGVVMPSKQEELAKALGVKVDELVHEMAVRTVFDDAVEKAIRLELRLAPEARNALVTVYRHMLKGSGGRQAGVM